jgi:two-component system, cell cycle sensor histidine kinase and response regulator CckA
MPSTLETIRRLSESLLQHTNVDDIVRQVLHTALEVIGEDAGSVLLAEEKTKRLIFHYVVGESADHLRGTSIPWDKGIAGAVFFSGRAEIIPAVREDPRHHSATDHLTGYESRDMIVVPLKRHGGTPIGVIEVLNKATGQVSRDDLDVLVVIASIAAAAIERTNNAEVLRQKDVQLQQSQKMEAMGRLAGGVAHDFNNLLTVMRGFSEMIVGSLDPSAAGRKYAEEVLKAAERASGLTRQLLAFSRKQVLEPRVIDLNGIVSNIEKILRQLIGKDINLSTKLDPNLGWVKADPSQIEQVILNLSVNAHDAMSEGGSLIIETANAELDERFARQSTDLRPGPYVLLSVSDTGTGMDQATLAKLFEPFFTTKAPGKGTGLGLSIIYGIVKQSHGHVAVTSEMGCGTTFKIYLPQVEAPDSDVDIAGLAPIAATGSETILVVDDEEQVRSLESGVLQSSGYKVLSVGNGQEALRILRESSEAIHLLVTDINMPLMNGRELARLAASLHPSMRVLFTSGHPDEAQISSAGMADKTNFLQKPFTTDSLLRRIRQSLDGVEESSTTKGTSSRSPQR